MSNRLVRLTCLIVLLGNLVTISEYAKASTYYEDIEEENIYQNDDLFESFNRNIWGVNLTLDRWAVRPIAIFYKDNIPKYLRDSISNVLDNLEEPLVAANNVLQINVNGSLTSFWRFVLNSTFGLAGMLDVASGWHLHGNKADFGQTFGVWGISSGPYLVLPFFGPSNVRDGVGKATTALLNPVGYLLALEQELSIYAVQVIDRRSIYLAVTEDLERNSLDFYAATRSLYGQQRFAHIQQGKSASLLFNNQDNKNIQ